MVPIEALAMSSGRGLSEFANAWQDEIRKSMTDEDEDENYENAS